MRPKEIEATILEETQHTRAKVEALSLLLNPHSLAEDPITILAETLMDLATIVRAQTVEIQELRIEVSQLSDLLQGLS